MKIKYAKASALGDREENQNWVSVTVSEDAVNMMVFDGMGGHTSVSYTHLTLPTTPYV